MSRLQGLPAAVGDRAGARQVDRRRDTTPAPNRVPFVVLGEGQDLSRPRPRALIRLGLPGLEAAEALGDVRVEAELPLLAVAHHVHPGLHLPPHRVGHGPAHACGVVRVVVGLAVLPCPHHLQQPRGARQAAGKRRQNAFGASLHPASSLVPSAGYSLPPRRLGALDGSYSTQPGADNRERSLAVASATAMWGEGLRGRGGGGCGHDGSLARRPRGGGGGSGWVRGGTPPRPVDSRLRGNDDGGCGNGGGGGGMTRGGCGDDVIVQDGG